LSRPFLQKVIHRLFTARPPPPRNYPRRGSAWLIW
jgi:hypothetical protein